MSQKDDEKKKDSDDENQNSENDGTQNFNLNELRLPQNYSEMVGVKKLLTTVPVRRPHRQEYIMVRPEKEWRFMTAVLEFKQERETYLIDKPLWQELHGEIVPKVLFTAINRQKTVFLWPVKLPGIDGRQDHWNRSALEAANMAMSNWIRIAANMDLGAYEVFEGSSDLTDPSWPEVTFEEVVSKAFKDNFIKSLDHPIIKRLRGIE